MPISANQATSVIIGHVLTPNPSKKWEEAIAVRDDEIVFLGGAEDLRESGLIGKDTHVIELSGGEVVIPGFQDGHVHPLAAGISETMCSLKKATCLSDALAMIKEYMDNNPDFAWITGSGWQWTWFSEHGGPKASILDEITGDKPAVFRCWDGHSAWSNSKALKLAGIHESADALPHADAHVERHPETRYPTGIFFEEAMPIIYKLLPPLSLSQKLRGLTRAIRGLYENGITSFQDAMVRKSNLSVYLYSYGVVPITDKSVDVSQVGQLPRASLCLLWELETGFEKEAAQQHIEYFIKTRELVEKSGKSDMIRAGTVKIMLDGVLESRTAYLKSPYSDADTTGSIAFTIEELCYIVTELDKHNFQVHVHAIGDGAVAAALDAFECARKAHPHNNNRHHIAHLQIIDPVDIPRFAKLHVVANFQPYWFLVDDDKYKIRPSIGPVRYEQQYPIYSVMQTGAAIAFGSDYPFGALSPIAGLHTAVNHFHPAASLKVNHAHYNPHLPPNPHTPNPNTHTPHPSTSSPHPSTPSPNTDPAPNAHTLHPTSHVSTPDSNPHARSHTPNPNTRHHTPNPNTPTSHNAPHNPASPRKGKKNDHRDHEIEHHNDHHDISDASCKDEGDDVESSRGFEVFLPGQKIGLDDAINFYTMGAAYVNYSEGITGVLEVGKKADMIVLSRNIFDIPQEDIYDTTVKLTMVNGKIVRNIL